MPKYSADWIYHHGILLEDHYIEVEDGVIKTLGKVDTLQDEELTDLRLYSDAMIVPGFVNTHNHSFQSLLKGFCDDKDFFTWRDDALYKYAKILTEEDIYNGALFAFGEMIKAGITTVCDFFYINDQKNDNANAVIRAAKDLGIRIVMARTMYDWDGAPERFIEDVDTAVKNTIALMEEYKDDPMVHLLPAPHSLHGASVEMIEAGMALAKDKGVKCHMHIAEGEYERTMMEEKHGLSPIRFLESKGIVNEHLVGIHCVWLDDEEIQMMADNKMGLAYNPSSNMFLGDGITRIKEMVDAGVCISLGTDGGCSNNRASIIEEMRMTSLLQKVKFCNSTVTTAESMMQMGLENGGKNLGLPVGDLSEGNPADFVIIDCADISMQPIPKNATQNAIKNLVYASQPSAMREVVIAGKRVLEHGEITTMPEPAIIQKIRHTTKEWT